jgi:hypothetical protein
MRNGTGSFESNERFYKNEIRKKLPEYLETAHDMAVRQEPKTDARDDELEMTIRRDATSIYEKIRARYIESAQSESRNIDSAQNAFFQDAFSARIDRRIIDFTKEIEDASRIGRHEAEEIYYNECLAQSHLRSFCLKNNIKRPADYPQSIISYYLIIYAILIVEGIVGAFIYLNAFAGLLGFVIAIVTSFLNIGPGIAVGYFFRFKNLPGDDKKYARIGAWSALVGWCVHEWYFAKLLGMFASLVQADSKTGIQTAMRLTYTLPNPFENFSQFSTIESVLMFGLALVFGGIAIWKGYYSSDAYPGYARADQQHKIWVSAIQGLMTKHRDQAKAVCDRMTHDLDSEYNKRENAASSLAGLTSSLNELQRMAEWDVNELRGDYRYSIEATRERNKHIREQKAPEYYENPVPDIIKPISFPNGIAAAELEKLLQRITEKKSVDLTHLKNATQKTTDMNRQAIESLDAFDSNMRRTVRNRNQPSGDER